MKEIILSYTKYEALKAKHLHTIKEPIAIDLLVISDNFHQHIKCFFNMQTRVFQKNVNGQNGSG